MTCDDRNQDLLLLAHGELGGIRRALMERHLRRCSVCQERRQQYGALSSIIAGEIRPPEMPAWSPHAPRSNAASLSARRLAFCVALAILLAVAATAGAVWSPPSWWSFGMGNRQSQTMDTSCQSNAPANVPISPPNQRAAQPAGNQPAPVTNVPAAPDACLDPAASTPGK